MYAMFYILLKVDTEGRNDSSGCTLSLLTIKNPRFQVFTSLYSFIPSKHLKMRIKTCQDTLPGFIQNLAQHGAVNSMSSLV